MHYVILHIGKGGSVPPGPPPPPPLLNPPLKTNAEGETPQWKFNGEITRWATFWDSAIHAIAELSDIDRFNYLHSLLEDTVADAISGLSLMATNYAAAFAILKKRFSNKQQVLNKHMDLLLHTDAVSSLHHLKGL